jgi:hypothetical protein
VAHEFAQSEARQQADELNKPKVKRHRGSAMAIVLVAVLGCSNPPEKKLTGRWTGAPNVKEDVEKVVDSLAQGKKVNNLAKGVAGFLGQRVADATMSVELDFQEGGRVFFRGNTDVLGLPRDSDGTWQVTETEPNALTIRFGTDTKQLAGKLLFRDKNEFTLKLDETTSAPSDQVKDGGKDQTQQVVSIVFKRMRS